MNTRLKKVFLLVFFCGIITTTMPSQAIPLSNPLQNSPRINAWFDIDGSQNGYHYRYDSKQVYNQLYYSWYWAPSGFNYYHDGHKGMDFKASTGTQVYSAAPGFVYKVENGCFWWSGTWCGGGFGNHVRVRHNDNSVTIYAHLDSVEVAVNDFVDCGSPVGKSGNTGFSSGPHLHFEYRASTYGASLDPFNYWHQTIWTYDALNQYGWMKYPTTACF